jgi:hypothetical protein
VSTVASFKERALNSTRARAAKGGNPPRFAYTHYFIESEGLHSRIHLQNFFSTFWPQIDAPATAHVTVIRPDGAVAGQRDYEIAQFGSVFIELSELLQALGVSVGEGMVAVDLEPPAEVRAQFHDLPDPESVQLNTPFWMAYYDDDGSYMYVHSIEMLRDQVIGANAALRWALGRAPSIREPWRSWRLIEAEDLTEMQLVVFNMGAEPGSTSVRVFDADSERVLFERKVALQPHQLERVKIGRDSLADDGAAPRHLRVGLEPLLTVNGKPYVLMRYGNGPLSVHHG